MSSAVTLDVVFFYGVPLAVFPTVPSFALNAVLQ